MKPQSRSNGKTKRRRRIPCASVLLALVAAGIYLSPTATACLQYQRELILRGQCWRLLSCHFTHFSLSHLLWDAGVFLGLGVVCELRDRRSFLFVLLVSAVSISIAVWFAMPELGVYRGLSGLDSALFGFLGAALIVSGIRTHNFGRVIIVAISFALFAAKLVVELNTGGAVFVRGLGGDVISIPLAHLVGLLVGALFGWRTAGPRQDEGATENAA